MAVFSQNQYDWQSLTVTMLGKEIGGIRSCKYNVKQEKELIYGAGNEPLGIGRGNKSYEGEIMLLQSEFESINALLGSATIQDMRNVNIVLNYQAADGTLITDVVHNVEFTDLEKGMAQGDKLMEITLPFIALGVSLNI